MDRFDAMRIFVRIAERRSFTLAADDLNVPRSTATDAVKQLEERLGVRLLDRTTRVVKPTSDGQEYYQRCVRLISDIEDAEAGFKATRPSGLLRVDVHGLQARHFLIPALPEFLECYPEIRLQLHESHQPVDMVRDGFDCIVRSHVIAEPSLNQRKLADLESGTYASPSYLSRFGTPRTLEDLHCGHRMMGLIAPGTTSVIPLMFMLDTEIREIMLPVALTVTGPATNRAAACEGIGIIQMPRYAASDDVASGRLIELLPKFPPPPIPVFVLYSHGHQLAQRVRVFIKWMVEQYLKRDIRRIN